MDQIRHLAGTHGHRCLAARCPFADVLWLFQLERRRRGSSRQPLEATETRTRTTTASSNANDQSPLGPDRRGEIPANHTPDPKQTESLAAFADARHRVRKDRRVHTCGGEVGVAT